MSLDVTTLNLIFIGTPGVVCYFVTSKLIGRVGRGSLEVVMLIFMYAFSSYAVYAYLGRLAAHLGVSNIAAELVLASPSAMRIGPADVAGASISAIVLAYVFAYGYRYNTINRLGQLVRASNRVGDEDVWHLFHSSWREPWASEWIVVRDHKVGLQYFGAVSQWSDSGEDRELLLMDVSVFSNADGRKLYDCDHLYVCRDKDDLTIEIHAAGRGITNA